jgi:hypothetical protein
MLVTPGKVCYHTPLLPRRVVPGHRGQQSKIQIISHEIKGKTDE